MSTLSIESVVVQLRAAGCVFAEDEAELLVQSARTPGELAELVRRRVSGLPLEQVVGWASFCGLRIAVDPGIFVPRRRSEFLVAQALDVLRAIPGTPVVVDLCCGSGAIGAAISSAADPVELYAAELDPVAVACARRNLGGRGQVFEGDLYDPLPGRLRGRVDVLVVNAPYVPTGEIALLPAEARDHEPRIALDGGADGLDVQRRVIASARQWLTASGHLMIETSERQAPHTLDAFNAVGFAARVVSDDELSATVVVGKVG